MSRYGTIPIEKLDRVGRRTYGMDDTGADEEKVFMPIQINIGQEADNREQSEFRPEKGRIFR